MLESESMRKIKPMAEKWNLNAFTRFLINERHILVQPLTVDEDVVPTLIEKIG